MPELNELLALEFNLDTAELLGQMEGVGLSDDVKGAVLANIILERVGRRQRRFNYTNPIDPEADECVAQYARTLEHADWVNGEDMVDAEEFNENFHRIEADVDSAARDAATALSCVMGLRRQLSRALEEIKGQINTLHGDVFELKDEPWFPTYPTPRPYPWPGVFDPGYGVTPTPGVFNPGLTPDLSGLRDVGAWENTRPWMVGGGGYPGTIQPVSSAINGPVGNLGGAGVWTLRGTNDVGTIGGMPATWLSDAEFNGDTVEVWSTPAGMFLTPVSKIEDARLGYIDPRVELGGRFGAWASENADVIKETFQGEAFTAAQLEDKFGSQSIGSGLRVAEALKGFSGGTKFGSADELIDRFSERQAERIIASGASVAVKIGAFGVVPGGGAPADAKIESFSAIPEKSRSALARGGFETIGDLRGARASEMSAVLERAGLPAGQSEIANWQGMARVVSGLK